MENLAAQVLELNAAWEATDKITLAENIEKYLAEKYPDCTNYTKRLETLAEITGGKKESVYAWINRGRNVKAPMLKVCVLANALEIDVYKLLEKSEK